MAVTRSFLKNEPPVLGQLVTLAVGLAGAFAFHWLELPGAYLSGAMVAVALLSVPGKATSIGTPLRWIAMVLSGVSIGSAVTPETLRGAATYPLSIVLMAVAAYAVTGMSTFYLMRVHGWNKATALLSSTPGAMSTALIIAGQTNASIPRIVVVQLFRAFLLMAVLPIVVTSASGQAMANVVHADDPLWLVALIAVPGLAFGWLLERWKVAGGLFLGIMAVSGFFHGTSIAVGRPPDWFMASSQILIGAWIGSRFVGFDWKSLGGMLGAALGSVTCSIVISLAFAWATSHWLGFPIGQTMLAFAPGAFEAMTLLAFALGLDPLYAVAHHLMRVLVMTFSIPVIMKVWLKDSIVRARSRSFRN